MVSQQSHLLHPKYRRDIDGLRAFAVLAVVIFHAFPRWLKGGFVGVDIFFVISGFLISTIIFENLDKGTFQFYEFYARRIRRIFPALLLILTSSLIFGWFVLLDGEYQQLGKHTAAGAGFFTNIALWKEAGYFDDAANTKPLLHLWSLGVEEQYYIVWPPLLWLAWKRKFNLLTITLFITIISFALNIAEAKQDKVADFYSLQTRFWELLSGSLLAWAILYKKGFYSSIRSKIDGWLGAIVYKQAPEADGKTTTHLMSFLGFLLLAYGFWRINKDFSFPGKWALVPVMGTVLLIASGPKAWINQNILSNRIPVWLGLISYPLYLWHWPILSFARIIEPDAPSRGFRITAILLSTALAWLTYKCVEQPIRLAGCNKFKVVVLIVFMTVVGGLGYLTYYMDGFAFRFPKNVQGLTKYQDNYEDSYRQGTCFLKPDQTYDTFANCDPGIAMKEKTLLLWGDSHAAHLYTGFKANYGNSYTILQRTASACPPILDIDLPLRPYCRGINDKIIAYISTLHLTRIELSADWPDYDLSKLDDTVLKLKSLGIKNIDLIGPVPQWYDGLPKELYLYLQKTRQTALPYRMSFGLNTKFVAADDALREKAAALKINYISPKDILCNSDGCVTRVGDTIDDLMTRDTAHLTPAGAKYLVDQFPKF